MKKLLLIAIFSFIGATSFAQDTEEMDQEKTEQWASTQDGYSEVMMDELPEEVTSAVEQNHPNAKIDNAYWNDKSLKYKLDIKMQDGTSSTLYLNKKGDFVEEQ